MSLLIKGKARPKVFIDTNILKWGILTREEIREIHPKESEFLINEVSAIRSLIQSAKRKEVILCWNMESKLEEMWSTNFSAGRSVGDLLNGVDMEYIEPPFFHARVLGGMELTKSELSKLRDKVFASCNIERFADIKRALGGNKNADAYHIYSAEVAKLDYFVTVDKKLISSVRNQKHLTFLVRILFPSELLARLQ